MRRHIARAGRLLLAAALAYLTVGIIWETAFGLAQTPLASAGIASPWEGLVSFLAWFALPSVLWPSSMSELIPGGWLVTIALFALMTALMFIALALVAPGGRAATGPRPTPRRRPPSRGRVGTRRTS